MSWAAIYPATQEGARDALGYDLAGAPGFESEVQADGSLYTLGRAILVRPGVEGFEIVFGPSDSKFMRVAVAMRAGLGQEKSNPGDVIHTVPYGRASLGQTAWHALDYAHKGERAEYVEFAPVSTKESES